MNPDNPNFRTPEEEARAQEFVKLKVENDILKSKVSQFESTLKETIRVRDAEIEALKTTVENNRLEHEWPIVKQLAEAETTIAQQKLVIEKLREQRNAVIKAANQSGLEYGNPKNWDKELEAIEKEGET